MKLKEIYINTWNWVDDSAQDRDNWMAFMITELNLGVHLFYSY